MVPGLRIPVEALEDQFAGVVVGRTLILDGDFPAYALAATKKTVPTAIRHFQQRVLEYMFMAQAQDCSVHLTASDSLKSGRGHVLAAKPYQGNRKGKAKPAILEPLRQALAQEENWLPEFTVTLHREREADDGMMIEAHARGNLGVIRSGDKDLRMTPYPYYEESTGLVLAGAGFGWIDIAHTEGGTVKMTGQGVKFFWGQMLTGDTADNVQGIKRYKGALCGPATGVAALAGVDDPDECANIVIDGYRAIDQNPLPEAMLLWILRHEHETVLDYLRTLQFSPANQQFLLDCFHREWYRATDPSEYSE